MTINRKATRSRGDVMKRLDDIEAEIEHLKTARRLPNSSFAAGGPRTRGGRFLAEDLSGDRVFEVSTEPSQIFMRPELISTVARQVIGASVFFDSNPVNAIRDAFDTFGDLEALIGGAASPGPTVSFELSGTEILCLWGSQMQAGVSDGTEVRAEGFTGIEISGPTPTAPGVGTAQHLNLNYPNVSGLLGIIPSGSHGVKFTEMTPGSYTATLKFRIDDHGSSGLSNIVWNDRWLTVIAF